MKIAAATQSLSGALQSFLSSDADVIIVLSPHGRTTGVYGEVAGDLDGFGIKGISAEAATDDVLVKELADRWNRPVLDGPVDHGITVPLLLATFGGPIVAATVAESTGAGTVSFDPVGDALSFADALAGIDSDVRIGFVASAHTSAGLSPRAPLTHLPGVEGIEGPVLRALENDPGALEELVGDLHARAGACGAGPLAAFGRLLGDRQATSYFYAAPFGVGYPVVFTKCD